MARWNHRSVLRLLADTNESDPIVEIRNRARNLVIKALEKGWQGPPFDPIELAKILNIDITPNDSVVDAKIVPLKKGTMQIQYNPFQKPTRINFSIAHEIAHTFFPDCEEEVRFREEDTTDNQQLEQLCNIGASEIQLPYAVFTNDANSIMITIENLIGLATKYKASLESVFLRFIEVVDKPCGIGIGIFKNENEIVIDYFKSSTALRASLPPGYTIPKSSKAYECISPGWTARETTNWDGLGDQEFSIHIIGISPYKRDNRSRVGILIVPSEYSKEEDNKIVLEFGDATKPRGKGVKIIAHVVNTSKGLGFGFGKSLAKNYPIVKKSLENWSEDKDRFQLGKSNLIKVDEELYVFQMLAQKGLFTTKSGEIPIRYSSLRSCLMELGIIAERLDASIHMPQIGAGQAKGDWNIIAGMIFDELISKGIKVNIYLLPGKVAAPKTQSSLTEFKLESTWETGKLF